MSEELHFDPDERILSTEDMKCELEHPLEKVEMYVSMIMWALEHCTDERSAGHLEEAKHFWDFAQKLRVDYEVGRLTLEKE